jgi:hypothetical protein
VIRVFRFHFAAFRVLAPERRADLGQLYEMAGYNTVIKTVTAL